MPTIYIIKQITVFIFEACTVETSLPPSQVDNAGQPVKRVVTARNPAPPRPKRPRTAKRLFLAFIILFGLVVYWFITGGN